jgi:hypothetical protein
MAMLNRKTRFATEGLRFMRLNPDGTIPTAARFLGFANTVDLSAVLVADIGDLTVKVDGGAEDTNSINFTAAADITAVTVAEAVAALTTAAFTGITWSADSATGRLKGVSATGAYVQVYGELAAPMDFGQGLLHGGEGLKFYKFFDDEAMSIGLPKNIKDKEEIDQEGALGTITRMVIGAKLLGLSPVVALKVKDYDVLELVQGGTYNRTAVPPKYDPPTSDVTEHPTFFVEIFSPIYAVGITKLESRDGYEMLLLRSCMGIEGDVPIEAKSWANYAFNLEATEYFTEAGVKLPAYQEGTLTEAQFLALDVENV